MAEQAAVIQGIALFAGVFAITLTVTLLVNALMLTAVFRTNEFAPPVWEAFIGLLWPSWEARRNEARLMRMRKQARDRYAKDMRATWKVNGWLVDDDG